MTSLSVVQQPTTVGVLMRARAVPWGPHRDIYAILSLVWRQTGMECPYASLTAAVWAVVPGGDILAWNDADGRTAAHVAALFGVAARRLLAEAAA